MHRLHTVSTDRRRAPFLQNRSAPCVRKLTRVVHAIVIARALGARAGVALSCRRVRAVSSGCEAFDACLRGRVAFSMWRWRVPHLEGLRIAIELAHLLAVIGRYTGARQRLGALIQNAAGNGAGIDVCSHKPAQATLAGFRTVAVSVSLTAALSVQATGAGARSNDVQHGLASGRCLIDPAIVLGSGT